MRLKHFKIQTHFNRKEKLADALCLGAKKKQKKFAIKYRSIQSHHLIAKAGKTTLLSTLKHNLKPTQQRAVSYPNPCIWKNCEDHR